MLHRIKSRPMTQTVIGEDPETDISLNVSSCCCSLSRRLMTEQCELPCVPRGLGGTKAQYEFAAEQPLFCISIFLCRTQSPTEVHRCPLLSTANRTTETLTHQSYHFRDDLMFRMLPNSQYRIKTQRPDFLDIFQTIYRWNFLFSTMSSHVYSEMKDRKTKGHIWLSKSKLLAMTTQGQGRE